MKETRKGKILEKLMSIDTITTNDLAILFQVSSRTIRNDIKSINEDLLPLHAEIELKPNKGAHLSMADPSKLASLLESYQEESMDTNDARIFSIITFFLLSKHTRTTAQMTRAMYLSESQLLLDLKKANRTLMGYQLEIRADGKQGYRLVGREKDKRRYLVDHLKQWQKMQQHVSLSVGSKQHMSKKIEAILAHNSYAINDDMFQYLLSHIMIGLYRFEQGFPIEPKLAQENEFAKEKEMRIAQEIADWMEQEFQCKLPKQEVAYIALQLLAKKQVAVEDNHDEEITAMISTILEVIHQKFSIDFSEDEDLKKSLYLHMMPLMNRMRYDLELRNPLIAEIKMNYPLTYDLAGEVALILHHTYGFKLKEDEIAYLSIHFNLALERYKRKMKKFNVLVVFAEGTSTSKLLEYKFQNIFHEYLNEVTFISVKKVKKEHQKNVDMIISTHDLGAIFPEYIRISPFLNERDQANVFAHFLHDHHDLYLIDCISSHLFFTDIKAESKNEALIKICQRLERIYPDLEHLYDSIMARESLLTTELGNLAAFPHPLNPLGSTTFMSVTILDHPVLWDNQAVQIIFLSTIAKDNDKHLEQFYASFVEIVKDELKITQLLKKRDFSTLLNMVQMG